MSVRIPQEVARQQATEQLEKAEASRVVMEGEAAKQAEAARELGGQVETLKAQLVCHCAEWLADSLEPLSSASG